MKYGPLINLVSLGCVVTDISCQNYEIDIFIYRIVISKMPKYEERPINVKHGCACWATAKTISINLAIGVPILCLVY